MTCRRIHTFDQVKAAWTWRAVAGCPGRFVLRGTRHDLEIHDLIGDDVEIQSFRVEAARDVVLVAPLEGGGLISYAKSDGTFVHTLNTEEGFRRKLDQLGIRGVAASATSEDL